MHQTLGFCKTSFVKISTYKYDNTLPHFSKVGYVQCVYPTKLIKYLASYLHLTVSAIVRFGIVLCVFVTGCIVVFDEACVYSEYTYNLNVFTKGVTKHYGTSLHI